MHTLTVICRQPLAPNPGEHTEHDEDCCDHECDCGDCGHENHSADCCGYDPENDSRDTAPPSPRGDHRQCGASATFSGATLTAALDQAVTADWRVDLGTKGLLSRADVCPGCNPGRRMAS